MDAAGAAGDPGEGGSKGGSEQREVSATGVPEHDLRADEHLFPTHNSARLQFERNPKLNENYERWTKEATEEVLRRWPARPIRQQIQGVEVAMSLLEPEVWEPVIVQIEQRLKARPDNQGRAPTEVTQEAVLHFLQSYADVGTQTACPGESSTRFK